jgi:hypothetical protein
VVLTRTLLALALAWSTAACDSAPPSPPTSPELTVVARWVANDGSVVALNVVLARDADRGRIPALARSIRDEHPAARVIVTFFASDAGPERFVIGYVPAADVPLPVGARPSSAIATFDFRSSPTPTDDGARIDGPDARICGIDLEARAGE